MNAAHFHLMVNHAPLFAALFGAMILAVGLLRKQKSLEKVGLVLAVLTAITAFVAVQSGERAEEIAEDLAGVVETTIHDHEEAAEGALLASMLLGVVAFAALVLPERQAALKRATTVGALVLTLVAFGLLGRAANLGGLIRHSEIATLSVSGSSGEDHQEHVHKALGAHRGVA